MFKLMVSIFVCLLGISYTYAYTTSNNAPLKSTSLSITSPDIKKKTIYFSTLEVPPYISEKLPYSGVILRIISDAYKSEGYTVKYEWLPPKRAEFYARKGLVDGFIGGQKTFEREKQFNFGDPAVHLDIVFFHLKNFNFNWETVNDLKGLTVGSRIGVKGYGDDFWEAAHTEAFHIEYTKNTIHSIRQLLAGRIDVFPTQKYFGFAIINQFFTKEDAAKITYNKNPLNTGDYYILFSKKGKHGQEIIDAFNSGLRKLKANGQYDKWLNDTVNSVQDKFDKNRVEP